MKRIISPADAVLSVPEPVSPALPESQNMNVTLNPVDVVFGSTNRSEVQPSPLVPVTDVRTEAGYTPPKATFFEAMGGQLSELSLYSSIINAVSKDDPVHEAVPDFDAVSTYNNDKDAQVFQFSSEDQKALWNTVSPSNYNDVKETILGRQLAEKAISENVWGGVVGGMVDADLLIGLGVGKVVQGVGMASKLKHYGTSAIAGATVVGGVSAASGRTGETLAWDVFAGAMGSLVPHGPKLKTMPKVTPEVVPPKTGVTPDASIPAVSVPNTSPTVVEAAETLQPGYKQYLSSHDKAALYFGDDLANRVLANPKADISDSAVAWGRDTLLELDTALVPVEQAIASSVPGWFSLSRLRGSKANALREETNALTKQARVWLNQAQQAEYRGVPLPAMPADARVQKIIGAYTESNFGLTAGTRLQQAGVYGADMITPSKYYIPVKHSYTKMAQWAGTNSARWNDLYTMYGQQISNIYPNLTAPAVQGGAGLTLEAVGKKFVKTQEAKLTDPKAQAFRGTTKDELEAILIDAGVDRNTLQQVLDPLQRKADEAGKIKPLKRRMDWDYSGLHVTSKGETISINDFMDDDLLGNLNGYARSISGRVGLGRVGYTTEADLRADFNEAIGKLPVESRADANDLANNIIAQVTGAPIGERAPDWFRTMTSLGALTQLANAGIYGVAEFSRITREFGISTVAKHFVKSFSGAIKGANKMTVKEGTKLQDILSGRLFAEGRLRPYITHLDDNWSGPAHNIHESVSFAAQYTKYITGGEAMRRVLINLNAGIMDELLVNLNKAGSTTSRDYLRSLNVADADIDAIAEQVRLHDTVMDSWDETVRTKAMNMLTSATDNLTMSVRHGEQPAFVEHSAIGRVMFPYMRYVFGATNKVLRRSYNRNGAAGVALDLVASAPLMVLAAGASNVVNGRDFDDNIAIRALRASPTLGMVGIVGEGLAMGELGGAIPAYGMANNLFKLSNKAATGDLSIKDVIQSVPGVGIFPGTRLALSAIEDKD